MIVLIVGAVLTALFGFLWIRDATRGYRGAPEPAPAPPPIPAHLPEAEEGEVIRYPRSKFLEATTLGLGAVIGGVVTASSPRLHGPAAVHRPGPPRHRRRRDRRLSREQVRDHDLPARPRAGRGLAAHGVHPQQRPARRRAKLHDPLEPLRPSRLPRAGERPAAGRRRRRPRQQRRRSRSTGFRPPPPRASAARATAASTTRRATERPARRCARSTATSS